MCTSACVNERKQWRAAPQVFTSSPGGFYNGDWHFVEAFVRMNPIVGLVIAPHVGDRSPVTQSPWIDNLTVATGRP
jgi:hypothetical protein